MYKGSFKGVYRKLQGWFKENLECVSRKFQGNVNGVSSKIEGCFK